MRGQFLHNEILVRPFRDHFEAAGARVRSEHPVYEVGLLGYIDLVARFGETLIAVEAELTLRRVPRDLRKAAVLGAGRLLIVFPHPRIAKAAETRFGDQVPCPTWFLPLGVALQRVRKRFPIKSESNDPLTTRHK